MKGRLNWKLTFISAMIAIFFLFHVIPNPVDVHGNLAFAENVADLQAFDLLSVDEGWLLINQHLYWTKTAGQDWLDISPPNLGKAMISAVSFLDTQKGWLILTNIDESGNFTYSIARTFDSGNTWKITQLSLFEPGDVNSLAGAVYLQFIDPQVGWLVIKRATSSNFSVGTLFKTSDGGNTWAQLTIPIGEPVYFVTSKIGWTAGGAAGDKLYRTQDGGVNWCQQKIESPSASDSTQRQFYQLPTFESENVGVLPVIKTDGDTTQVQFYITDNSGQSWNIARRVPVGRDISHGSHIPLTVFDGKRWMMIVPNTNRILKTSKNRELTTEISDDPMTSGITKLDMVTSSVGWAKHVSGSRTPEAQPVNTSTPSPHVAVSYTLETRLLRTDDGGRNWKVLNIPNLDSSMNSYIIPKTLGDRDFKSNFYVTLKNSILI
jgi:photosystem II stability/assembly factor-like uncharacterized protein